MKRRGTSLVAVLFVLAMLSLAIGTAGRVLSANVRVTRLRQEAHYAKELARSGVAWAEGYVESGGDEARRVLAFRGGEARVTITRSDGGFRVVSVGRALAGWRALREWVETADVRSPGGPSPLGAPRR